MKQVYGTIFNIQRFSVHDGPGIRTVVFEKGCPLRCQWCANPESQRHQVELGWTKSKCIGCRECEKANLSCNPHFEEDTLMWGEFTEAERSQVERICPSKALHTIGYETSVEEVLGKVDRDEIFYSNLDGGLTISGGEPLMQPEFTYSLLKEARGQGIHTAIETTGYATYEIFEKIAGQLDYLLMDIKSMDEEIHREYTGVSNQLILENFVKIRNRYPSLPILVRTPVIPGVNDREEEIAAIHDFIFDYDNVKYELLKYHRLGEAKYESLHRAYPMGERSLNDENFIHLKKKYQFDHINREQLYTDGGGI